MRGAGKFNAFPERRRSEVTALKMPRCAALVYSNHVIIASFSLTSSESTNLFPVSERVDE